MRSGVRCWVVVLISFGLLNLQLPAPAEGAEVRPFGIVIRADHAHVDEADVSNGSTVFPGDSLETNAGGELRLTLGKGQVYLLSASAASLAEHGHVYAASVLHGTVGFSALTAAQFQLDTPEGTVNAANDQPAFGQVTITGPKELTVTAYSGSLLLQRNDQKLTILPGQSYDVALVPDDSAPPQGAAGVKHGYNDKLVWKLIIVGAAALAGYLFWRHWSESPIDPK